MLVSKAAFFRSRFASAVPPFPQRSLPLIRPRLAAALVATVLLAACGGVNSLPGAPSTAPTATPSSATFAVSTTGVTQTLSVSNGATAQIGVVAAAGSATTTSIVVSSSATAPTGSPTIASGKRHAMSVSRVPIAYFSFVSSATVQLGSYPSFQITFPATILPTGTTIHEAFLDASMQPPGYSYDIASGPNAATLTATGIGPTLLAGRPYIFAFYYESGSAATPSPGPTATPNATPTPTASSTPSPAPTPAVTPTATPTTSATPSPTATPSVAPTASPTPSASATPVASGSATFSAASGYNGLLTQIPLLATTASGNLSQGFYNATFFSIPPGQTGGQAGGGVDGAHPNRNITLEVNDNVPISNTLTYGKADFTNSKILLTYGEQFGAGGYGSGRYWIANGGTITFENVANGSATYRIRGATFQPDTSFTSNQATGTFVLDAVGTANPFSQK